VDIDVSAAYTVFVDETRDYETFDLTAVADRGLATQAPKVVPLPFYKRPSPRG
jgi:hypothetical protein